MCCFSLLTQCIFVAISTVAAAATVVFSDSLTALMEFFVCFCYFMYNWVQVCEKTIMTSICGEKKEGSLIKDGNLGMKECVSKLIDDFLGNK